MTLPYPKSFPNSAEADFLHVVLSSDEEFPRRWQEWKDTHVFEDTEYATSRLFPLAYLRMEKLGIKDELTDRMKGIYKSAWVKNQRLIHAAKEVTTLCHAEGIPVLLLKGIPLLLEVYQDRGARFLGDADILISPEHGPRVMKLLREHGWDYAHPWVADRHHPVPSVFQVIKSSELRNEMGIEMDIHWNIVAANHGISLPGVLLLKELPSSAFRTCYWAHTTPMDLDGVPCARLSNEDMLIHLVVHGAEGNEHRALRWVVDAMMIMRELPINWDIVLERIREFGFLMELRLGFSYLASEFNAPIPASFLEELERLPLAKAEQCAYYHKANTEHNRRINVLGNIPLLWYAYWKYEEKPYLFGFPQYLRTAWGLTSYAEILSFAFTHFKRKLEARDPAFFHNLRSVTRDSFYTVAGRALSFLASFAVVTVMARVVPREIVGSYNYVIATLTIVSITTLPGMNEAVTRAVGRGFEGSLHSMMRLRLLFGLVGSVIAAVIGAVTWVGGNAELGMAFLVAAPFVPLTDTFSNFAIQYWQGKKRFDRSALIGAVYYLGLALLSIPVLLWSHSLLEIVGGIMLAQAVVGYGVYRSITPSGLRDPESEKLGIHLTIMRAFSILGENADRLVIWYLFGPAMVAVYSFATTPLSKVYQMLPIGIVALPYLSAQTFTKRLKKDILLRMCWLFALSIPGTALAIFLAPMAYHLLFPLYPESVIYFQILFLSVILSPIMMVRSALVAFHRTASLYVTDMVMPLVKIALMILLAILFGMPGLIASLLLIGVLNFFVTLVLFVTAKTAS